MRRVFFSFHYEDVITFRANVVRNVFDTAPGPPTGPYDDPQNLVQSFKKLFLNT